MLVWFICGVGVWLTDLSWWVCLKLCLLWVVVVFDFVVLFNSVGMVFLLYITSCCGLWLLVVVNVVCYLLCDLMVMFGYCGMVVCWC